MRRIDGRTVRDGIWTRRSRSGVAGLRNWSRKRPLAIGKNRLLLQMHQNWSHVDSQQMTERQNNALGFRPRRQRVQLSILESAYDGWRCAKYGRDVELGSAQHGPHVAKNTGNDVAA